MVFLAEDNEMASSHVAGIQLPESDKRLGDQGARSALPDESQAVFDPQNAMRITVFSNFILLVLKNPSKRLSFDDNKSVTSSFP